jgi:GDP-L-fucose synthase
MIKRNSKIYIAGHNGMVGSAIKRKLLEKGYKNLLTINREKLNLIDQQKTFNFLKKNKPDLVILAAAKVGGIISNSTNKDKFLYENLQIQNNMIHGSYLAGVKNLFFLGSSCIYPKHCKQPMKEKYLLAGPLEESNDAYSIAKIAGLKMCENYNKFLKLNYKSFMPPNMYGPKDNYDLNSSHFYPALLRKIYIAKIKKKKFLKIWGSGKARRELMFVDDFAEAIVFFMNKKIKEPFLNIGIGKDYTIDWYAKFLMKKLNVQLKIYHDTSKPDGMPKKCLDIMLAKKYGWKPNNDFNKSFNITFKDFLIQNKRSKKSYIFQKS